jgi:phenylalanyl-tRNA synthetase beta chain
VYDAKAVAVEMVARLSGREASVRSLGSAPSAAGLHPRGAAEVLVGEAVVGRFGPLHPDVIDAFDLGGPALVVELDLEELGALGRTVARYRPVPRLPAMTRDLSLVVADDLFAERVGQALVAAAGELCESIDVVGEFRGGSVPAGRRSLTFRVVYRDPKARAGADDARTLTDQEVDAVEKRMVEAARSSFGAELRG